MVPAAHAQSAAVCSPEVPEPKSTARSPSLTSAPRVRGRRRTGPCRSVPRWGSVARQSPPSTRSTAPGDPVCVTAGNHRDRRVARCDPRVVVGDSLSCRDLLDQRDLGRQRHRRCQPEIAELRERGSVRRRRSRRAPGRATSPVGSGRQPNSTRGRPGGCARSAQIGHAGVQACCLPVVERVMRLRHPWPGASSPCASRPRGRRHTWPPRRRGLANPVARRRRARAPCRP